MLKHSVLRLVVLCGCVLLLVTPARDLAAAGMLHAPRQAALARLEPGAGTYFGVNLDWATDSVAAYRQRLGHTPVVYVRFFPFPFDQPAREQLDDLIRQVGSVGGIAMLTLEPNQGLESITAASIDDLASRLATYNAAGVPIMVRLAHEMNGSWYPWSQQPSRYREVFRAVAEAVHRQAAQTAMLWAPNYGGGYPFSGGAYAAQPGTPAFAELDTNHDGRLSMDDDMYAPYYPGDDAVDWVGMSLYHWGNTYPWGENEVVEADKFGQQLRGNYNGLNGDERALPDFYADYTTARGKPLAIPETAALYNTTIGEPGQLEIKRPWWQQVFSTQTQQEFPGLKLISWFEWRKPEPEIGGALIDWSITYDPQLAQQFLADLPPGYILPANDATCFPETRQCIAEPFTDFWTEHGALPVFGFPIAPAADERNADTGQIHLTQWFERNRFELHPGNPAPYDVLLGRLGVERLRQQGVDWQALPRAAGPQPGCLWFEQTGHNVCDQAPGLGFMRYWQEHGLQDERLTPYGQSLALFGFPLTEPRMETNSSGDTVLTQWFERARFEWHPDKPDASKVLLGLLGNEVHGSGDLPTPPAERLDGLNFGPFTGGDDPAAGAQIDEQQLRAHLQIIRPYTNWIRTFGCGGGLELAGRLAHEMDLKIAVGTVLTGDPTIDQGQLACLMRLANAGEADAAIVGNGVLRSGAVSEAQLIAYLQQVRQAVPREIPVTTVDSYDMWLAHPDVVAAVDDVYVIYYPFYAGTRIEDAVAVLQGWHEQMTAFAAGKRVVVAESGWPSCGERQEQAVPSPEHARTYALEFLAWARAENVPYFYFEAFDEPWKARYDGQRGACWGIWDAGGNLKPGMDVIFEP